MRFKDHSRYVLGGFFVLAGLNHFMHTAAYVSIMPPYLPWHLELVYLSGVAEAALGTMLMFRRWSKWAAWGLVILLVAIFPANLHMALNTELYPSLAPIWWWLRLPLQGLLILWAWMFTRGPDDHARHD